MTIQGAVYELERMILRDDISDYIKPVIKKVIETVVDEYNEILKAVPTDVLNKIKVEITECAMPDFEYHGCGGSQKIVELEDVLEIIDKYKEEKENG